MPRPPIVYGKRSRAIYNPSAATFSSPEHPWPEPQNPAQTFSSIDKQGRSYNEQGLRRSPRRKALSVRSHNAVLLPVEAVEVAQKRPQKPRSRQKQEDGRRSDNVSPVAKRSNQSKRALDSGEELASVQKQSSHIRFDEDGAYPQPRFESEQTNTGKRVSDCPQHPVPEQLERVQSWNMTEGTSSQLVEVQHTRNIYEQHCSTLLDSSAHKLTCFETWSCQLSEHFSVDKIAEASFGEVYRLALHEGIPGFSSSDESVFKIIPLQAPPQTLPLDKRKRKAAMMKQEAMSKPEDVASEVKLLQRMSAIPGFTNFRDVRVLQGRPPVAFIKAFKAWNTEQKAKKKELSHFPDPARKTSYNDDQLWAVIEMQDAGTDLERLVENGSCTSIWTIWDIFWQVVLSLAKGEEGAEFEHRDLHLGNICVRSTSTISSPTAPTIDVKKKLNFTSLETTIIDYTISRCTMSASPSSPGNKDIAYIDLAQDPALFQGDASQEYQYEIYRYMRGALYHDDPHHACDDDERPPHDRDWQQFHPQTNLVWLHLVLYELLRHVAWPSATKAPSRKTKKEAHMRWKRANDLEHVLLRTQDLLDPGAICGNGVWSAGDLVVLALGEGWLDLEDVSGREGSDESALVSQLEGLEI